MTGYPNEYVTVADEQYPTMFHQSTFPSSYAGVSRIRRKPSNPSDISIDIHTAPTDPSPVTPALQSGGSSIGSSSQPNTPDRLLVHDVHVVDPQAASYLCLPRRSIDKGLASGPSSPAYDLPYHAGYARSKNHIFLGTHTRRRSRSTSDVPAAQDNVPPRALQLPDSPLGGFHDIFQALVASPLSAGISAEQFQTWHTPSPVSPQSELSSIHPASPYSQSGHDFSGSPVDTRFIQRFSELAPSPSFPQSCSQRGPDLLQGAVGLNGLQNTFLDVSYLDEIINSMGHFPMSGSQWQNGGQPPYYYYPQPQPEGFNTALQVSAAPEFGFGAHGNPAFSIDPAKLAEPLNPDLSIGVSHASGTGVPSFSVAGSMSTRRHLLQVRHKEAVYDILLQSSHKAEAAERVSSLAKDHNDDGYKTEFDKACLHHPKDSLTGRRKAEQRRTREPKFQCILCQDKMTTNNNLQNHYRSHLSLRKFQCPHCFTSFATDSIRARHLRNTVKCSGYNPNAVPKSKKEPSNKASNEHRASGSGTQ